MLKFDLKGSKYLRRALEPGEKPSEFVTMKDLDLTLMLNRKPLLINIEPADRVFLLKILE